MQNFKGNKMKKILLVHKILGKIRSLSNKKSNRNFLNSDSIPLLFDCQKIKEFIIETSDTVVPIFLNYLFNLLFRNKIFPMFKYVYIFFRKNLWLGEKVVLPNYNYVYLQHLLCCEHFPKGNWCSVKKKKKCFSFRSSNIIRAIQSSLSVSQVCFFAFFCFHTYFLAQFLRCAKFFSFFPPKFSYFTGRTDMSIQTFSRTKKMSVLFLSAFFCSKLNEQLMKKSFIFVASHLFVFDTISFIH